MKKIILPLIFLYSFSINSQTMIFEEKYYSFLKLIKKDFSNFKRKSKVIKKDKKFFKLTKVYAVENYNSLLIIAEYERKNKKYFNIIKRNEIKR